MNLLHGKVGLVFGVANDRSYATFIADAVQKHGGRCAFAHLPGEKNERRTRKAVEGIGLADAWLFPCDAGKDEDLDAVFARHTLAEWREKLATVEGVWAPMQTARELPDDPQVRANGYLAEVDAGDGKVFTLVANPVQFDERSPRLRPAPDLGQHTEEVLLELGLTWEELARYKEAGTIS